MARDSLHTGHAIVIGAGIGGLCSAARLCAAGMNVTVIETADYPGGKIRALPSPAGPVDAGPTVLTLKPIFDEVFRALGTRLEDHVQIEKARLLARHFWPDGSQLDLCDDAEQNAKAIAALCGRREAQVFETFHARTRALFDRFRGPMLETADPSLPELIATVVKSPDLLPAMAPLRSLDQSLHRVFSDPRLVQLFGRYATYVGGSPLAVPALLGLIWQAESRGVWHIRDGLAELPKALEALCIRHGATFLYNSPVTRITCKDGKANGVILDGTRPLAADIIVFNGDPRALAKGLLGPDVQRVARQTLAAPRSLSAHVWSFAARPTGVDLAHHNVFFSARNDREFAELGAGAVPDSPTIYVCAQDRGRIGDAPASGLERFEMIVNAPPLEGGRAPELEFAECQTRTFRTLSAHGLSFDPLPGPEALTRPTEFAARYPASLGALYGQSPHGMTASLKRPRARTPIRGLYLAGGGAHPGAGIPMAALSARHAVETIISDLALRSTSRPMAMPGGMSMASAPIKPGPSRS